MASSFVLVRAIIIIIIITVILYIAPPMPHPRIVVNPALVQRTSSLELVSERYHVQWYFWIRRYQGRL
jgi:hypothetical protein